jgi:type VI secretion system protein ImpG
MTDQLYQYYEQELTFFRQMAADFAQKYPKVAARLQLDETKESKDPHVERLIEAFALLAARVRRKVDDEFPEIVESLLNMLYPHYLRPVPPMAIAQFRFEPQQTRPAAPATINPGSSVTSRPVGGLECTFQTANPVTVWPLKITGASLVSVAAVQALGTPSDASHVLRIQMETIGALPLATLKIPSLRFFLNGDTTPHHLLYELLFVHACRVQIRSRSNPTVEPVVLEPDCIQPVGFKIDEGLLSYSDHSFLGYRLLQEYFQFPQKFFFFDLIGLNSEKVSTLGTAFEVLVFFRDSELREQMPSIAQAVTLETFQLGCTPIVNLFERPAETIRVSHAKTEYRVIPDRHRQSSMEVYSVEAVTSTPAYSEEPLAYQPFYSFRHTQPDQNCFWYAHRRSAFESGSDTPKRDDDDGTEVYLSLVDLDFKPTNPPVELLSVRVKCTNRDFVSRLPWRKEWGELQGEGLPLVEARCIVPPTATARPPLGGSLQWRLISHLSLNHLSIVQGGGKEALQEILRLYSFSDAEDINKRIAGIVGLKSESSVARVLFKSGVAFCRGLDVEVEFDEEQYAGSGVFLLASVLERFFGLYSAVNSYSRLTARTRRRGVLKRWPARIGEQKVL